MPAYPLVKAICSEDAERGSEVLLVVSLFVFLGCKLRDAGDGVSSAGSPDSEVCRVSALFVEDAVVFEGFLVGWGCCWCHYGGDAWFLN